MYRVYLKSLVKFQQSGASILGLDASQIESSLSHFLHEDGGIASILTAWR
jgi:hypothetical protein